MGNRSPRRPRKVIAADTGLDRRFNADVHAAEPRHCDTYIDDPSAPAALRAFLERARSPAHGMLLKEPFPKLFASYNAARVRVTMASRFGDVGIAMSLDTQDGYDLRVHVQELSDFGDQP